MGYTTHVNKDIRSAVEGAEGAGRVLQLALHLSMTPINVRQLTESHVKACINQP